MAPRSLIHVLLVEDSPTDVLLTHEALPAGRFQVQSRERLAEALEILAGHGFDVVLLDLGLPDSQGLDTLRTLRGRNPRIPVVVLTGKNDEELAAKSLQEGAQDYLVKGQVEHDVLGRAIRYAIERNQTRNALREANEFNRQVIGSVQEGIIVLDRDLRYQVWNAYMEALSGLKADDVLGKHPWQVHPLFTESASRQALNAAFAGEIVTLPDLLVPAPPPGRTAWITQQISPFRESDGNIVGVICTVRDITKRKQAETVLREKSLLALHSAEVGLAFTRGGTLREMLQCSVESMVRHLDAAFARIWTLNLTDNVLDLQASAGLYTHLDGPHGRVPVGKYKIGLIAQEKKPHLTNDVASDLRIGDPEWAKREGMVAFAGYPLLLEDRLLGVMAMFARQSISETTLDVMAAVANQIALGIERNVKQEALRAAQDRLQHLMSSSPAIVYSLKLEGEKVVDVWVSDRVKTLLNYDPPCSVDWWFANVHPDDLPGLGTMIPDTIKEGHLVNEYRFRHHDGGYRWIHDEKSLIRSPDGRPVECVGSWTDITEQKSLEQQLQQSQKMEAFGQLAGGVAHDFNNLLTIIMGYSEMLMESMAKDPRRKMLAEIHHAGERAVALTRQLLAFSRKQVLEPKVCDLNEIVANIEKMLRRLIGEDIVLTCNLSPTISQVKVDVGQMEQVVMNLAVNSRDAMPQGGRLTIETKDVEWDTAYCEAHPEFKPGRYVMLAVTDTGAGMTSEVKARIFEPFFTTKGLGKGTGLGLATVFGIIKQSDGQISVYSEVGVGTAFKIYLPAVKQRKASPSGNNLNGNPTPGTETILLVEDEKGLRKLAQLALETHGYKVLVASSGSEALNIAKAHQGPIQLLVTDVVMPEMSGRELTESLRERRAEFRVLYMSGYTDDAVVRHGIIQAKVAFLQKPFSPVALARKVREVLDEKQ